MRIAARTWGKQWWKVGGGGGTVWDNMTYDPELNRIYIGVGNAGPYNPRLRSPGGGDNLFIASILALDADTGRYVWHYQENPGDSWDYKSTANMITAELTIHDRRYKVLLHSPTNGFFYVIDRTNGRVISAEEDRKSDVGGPHRPCERAPRRDRWHPLCRIAQWKFGRAPMARTIGKQCLMTCKPGWCTSLTCNLAFGSATISHRGRTRWNHRRALEEFSSDLFRTHPNMPRCSRGIRLRSGRAGECRMKASGTGGTRSTGGGLVFQGTGDGEFLRLRCGERAAAVGLRCQTRDHRESITYTAGSRQYVSVLVGYGGATTLISTISNRGWKFGAQPRRLLTFALDAHEQLPPTQPRDCRLYAVDDPKFFIAPARAAAGLQVYQASCANCHGTLFVFAGPPRPDLRESRIAADWGDFESVVKQGTPECYIRMVSENCTRIHRTDADSHSRANR